MARMGPLSWAGFLILAVTAVGSSQPIDVESNINFYLSPADYAGCGTIDDAAIGVCANLTSPPTPGTAFVWVVASRQGSFPDAIGGIQFGIQWQGLDLFGWTLCTGGSEIPSGTPIAWPASGSGNAITWDAGCYFPPGDVAKVGYFTVADGATGSMVITGDPRVGQALYTTCAGAELFEFCTANLGAANLAMGTDPLCGDNCSSTPTREATWGGVKAHFGR